MKNTKNNKGITLVALIITIVVLLILAAVTIGAVNDSKIIAHSQNAAGSFNQAKTNEIEVLTDTEGLLGNLVNSINNSNTPTPPATTEIRYYKSSSSRVIQELKITGNNLIVSVYFINGDNINLVQEPIGAVINTVVNPVTISLSEGISEDITVEDMQIEVSENISAYIKGNYLYGTNIDTSYYDEFELITDTTEIADIEQKIANLNS